MYQGIQKSFLGVQSASESMLSAWASEMSKMHLWLRQHPYYILMEEAVQRVEEKLRVRGCKRCQGTQGKAQIHLGGWGVLTPDLEPLHF